MHMRKRIKHEIVCSCSADGQVKGMRTKELQYLVTWAMKAIELTNNTRQRAMRGLELGRLCEGSGHPVIALQVYTRTLSMVRTDNFDWEDIPINNRICSFDSCIAYSEQMALAAAVDRLWRRLGHIEYATNKATAFDDYRSIWLWKYQEPYWQY